MSYGTTVYLKKEYIQNIIQENGWKNITDINTSIDEFKYQNTRIKSLIKMICSSNPTIFQEDAKSHNFNTLEKYIFYRVNELFEEYFKNFKKMMLCEKIQDLFYFNFDFSDEVKEFLNDFKGMFENPKYLNLFENTKGKPYFYFRNHPTSKYELENKIETTEKIIRNEISEFLIWSMMDKVALSKAGMEVKEQTKYIDDKFEYTDVPGQLDFMFNNKFDSIDDEMIDKWNYELMLSFWDESDFEKIID